MSERIEELKKEYDLNKHVEGGSFVKVYTAPFEDMGRAYMGSIYFLLEKDELSHFHKIDCDEIWYYHEGCGMKITVLSDFGKEEFLLGDDLQNGERAMVVIPKGRVFGAENLQSDGYTFVSCVTTPNFEYSGFRLIGENEIKDRFEEHYEEVKKLAFKE